MERKHAGRRCAKPHFQVVDALNHCRRGNDMAADSDVFAEIGVLAVHSIAVNC